MRFSTLVFTSISLFGLAACAGDEFQPSQPVANGTGGGVTSSWTSTGSSTAGGSGGHGGATSTAAGGSGGSGGATTSTGSGGAGGATTSTGSGGSGGSPTSTGSGGASGSTTSTGSTSSTSVACSGDRQCVATAPEGWHGPIALAQTTGALPTCDVGFTQKFQGGVDPKGEGCSPCQCGPLVPGACEPSKVGYNLNDDCTTLPDSVPVESCTAIPAVKAVRAHSGQETGASCAPSGGEPGPWSWQTKLRVCASAPQGATCPNGTVCAATPSQAFGGALCVYQEGETSCPSGDYTKRTVLYRDVDDTRACGSCTCATPIDRTCGGEVRLFGNATCDGSSFVAVPADGVSCVGSLAGSLKSAKYFPQLPAGGACSPVTGTVFQPGEIAPKDPVTVCCMPNP